MSDSKKQKGGNPWPLPKFYFSVDFEETKNIMFQEVSGLDTESQAIEYRHGNAPMFTTIKMPGIAKIGNVTLKKGIFPKDTDFWAWYDAIKMNTIKRQTVIISLLDETAKPTMTWTLTNAWPSKVGGTDLKSEENEVAVETIELTYEEIKIST